MLKATLTRNLSTIDGTDGELVLDYGGDNVFSCYTLELPWKANAPKISCIPEGKYTCEWRLSPRFKRKMYTVMDVPGRSGILFHIGNVAGDTAVGLKTDVQGCILLGLVRGSLYEQKAVLNSGAAVRRFEELGNGKAIELTIKWRDSNGS